MWEHGSRGRVSSLEKKGKVIVTGVYVPTDEESA